MALIKCVVCGKDISENAVSCPHCGEPLKPVIQQKPIRYETGTEYFTVTEENRPYLSGKTSAQIEIRTAELAKDGKIVTHVHVSDPQPMKAGFTFWQNNVTLTWQADPDEERYKSFCYNETLNKYRAAGNSKDYEAVLSKLKAFSGYKDADSYIERCQRNLKSSVDVEAQQKTEREIYVEAGGPNSGLWFLGLLFAGTFLLTGSIGIIISFLPDQGGMSGLSVFLFLFGIIVIAAYIIKDRKGKAAVANYRWKERERQREREHKERESIININWPD